MAQNNEYYITVPTKKLELNPVTPWGKRLQDIEDQKIKQEKEKLLSLQLQEFKEKEKILVRKIQEIKTENKLLDIQIKEDNEEKKILEIQIQEMKERDKILSLRIKEMQDKNKIIDIMIENADRNQYIDKLESKNINLLELGKNNLGNFINEIFVKLHEYLFKKQIIKNKLGFFISENTTHKQNLTKEIRTLPAMYISGGSAYEVYYNYIHKILNYSYKIDKYPRTIDYDLTFCLNERAGMMIDNKVIINNDIIRDISEFFKYIIQTKYNILNKDNYLDLNFKKVTEGADIFFDDNLSTSKYYFQKNEYFICTFKTIVVTIYMDPLYKYNFNIRISVMPNTSNTIERLVDIVFTTDETIYSNIKFLNMLKTSRLDILVPTIDSLIKTSLIAIINRGHDLLLFKKCQKDVLRLELLFKMLNMLSDSNKLILGYINLKYFDIFNYIISILVHCTKNILPTFVETNYINKLQKVNPSLDDMTHKYNGPFVIMLQKLVENPKDFIQIRNEIDIYLEQNKIKNWHIL